MHATRPSVGISFAPRIGQPIPGYRLIRRCGRGGFAEVWEAEAPGGFRVALKLVRLSGKNPSGELRAIEVVRGIRHSNLLPIFGAWQVDDVLVIGSELADRSLWDRFLEAIAQGLRGIPRGSCWATSRPRRPGSISSTRIATRWTDASGWASSTATSSRRTSCCSAAAPRWPTSAWSG